MWSLAGRPHLEKKLTKNVGTSIGLEFREGSLSLNGKNETRVRAGMTFNVAVGLEGLEDKEATDKRGQTYAIFLVCQRVSTPLDLWAMACPDLCPVPCALYPVSCTL